MAADGGWIFVSSANKDRQRVGPLLDALKGRGLDLRRYENLVRPGLAWEGVMAEVRSKAGAVLVVWSQAAAASPLVTREASVAAGAGRLIDAALDGPEFVPAEYATSSLINLGGWNGDANDARIDRLADALADAVAQPRLGPGRLDAATVQSLSSTVAAVRDRLRPLTPVPAMAIVRALAELHPEYGEGGLGRASLDGRTGGELRLVDDWLEFAARSHYVRSGGSSRTSTGPPTGTVVHGRVVLAALADADPTVREALGEQLLTAVQRELNTPGVDDRRRRAPDSEPEQQAEPELAGYIDADVVPWDGQARLEDRLMVSTYVKMLATVVASRDTPMPLSIGLFGEWGSGKSYFMGLMQQEIRSLAAKARTDDGSPFCSSIVAVHFNAWHYADANLWASLAVQVFDKLARADSDDSEEEAKARQVLLTELDTYKEAEAALREQEARARQALEAAEKALLDAEVQRHTERERLDAEAVSDLADAVANDERVKPLLTAVRSEIAKIGSDLDIGEPGLAELPRVAGELRAASVDVGRIWRSIRRRNPRQATLLVVTAVVLGLAGVTLLALPGAVRALGAPSLVAAVAALSRLVRAGAEVVVPLRKALSHVESTLRVSERAWDVVEQRREDRIEVLRRRVAEAHAEQEQLARQRADAQERVSTLDAELTALEAGPRLYRFIAERAGSDDYRRQLGIISAIRQDFETLSRRRHAAATSKRPGEQTLERIVLYIDDLDRCPPDRVVQVLEAVHLLLAMDLFVVVVGVDPRWLLRSLRRQFRELLSSDQRDGDDSYWRSTPQNYLEKIFQIPFVLPAMTAPGFHTLLRSLVRPPASEVSLADATTVGRAAPNGAVSGRGDPLQNVVVDPPDLVAEKGSPIERLSSGARTAPLDLREDEVDFLALLAPLVKTPRAAKRMVNVYRMLRVTRDLRPASTFLGRPGAAGEYQAVAQLLGVLTGFPTLMGRLCWGNVEASDAADHRGLLFRPADESWSDFVDRLEPERSSSNGWENGVDPDIPASDVDDWQRLVAALQRVRPAVTIEDRLRPYQEWVPAITRFSFEMSRFTGATSPAPSLVR